MPEKFRVMIYAKQDEANAIKQTLKSTGVLGVYPNTHYEGELVRGVYDLPNNVNFDDFEDAVQEAVQAAFPGAPIDRRIMIVHIKR